MNTLSNTFTFAQKKVSCVQDLRLVEIAKIFVLLKHQKISQLTKDITDWVIIIMYFLSVWYT